MFLGSSGPCCLLLVRLQNEDEKGVTSVYSTLARGGLSCRLERLTDRLRPVSGVLRVHDHGML